MAMKNANTNANQNGNGNDAHGASEATGSRNGQAAPLPTRRREWMLRVAALAGAPALLLLGARRGLAQAGPEPQVVRITAQRFHYTPREFQVRPGPVVLEFTSVDFVHGFHLPDFKLRADLPPGRVTRVSLNATQPGSYDFLCDNFCGDGHEEMSGRMIVMAA